MKQDKMEDLVQNERKKLIHLWDLCCYSEIQKKKFVAFNATDFTESLLIKHEKEVQNLQGYYEVNEELFRKARKRQD